MNPAAAQTPERPALHCVRFPGAPDATWDAAMAVLAQAVILAGIRLPSHGRLEHRDATKVMAALVDLGGQVPAALRPGSVGAKLVDVGANLRSPVSMPVPSSDDLLRPALILLAHDNEGTAGDLQTYDRVLNEAYAAARLVFPIVRIDVRLWSREDEGLAIGHGVCAGDWDRDDVVPGCVIIDVDGFTWQCPEGVSATSTVGAFAGFAASIVAARLLGEEALRAAMIAQVVAASRAALAATGVDPSIVRKAGLANMLPPIGDLARSSPSRVHFA